MTNASAIRDCSSRTAYAAGPEVDAAELFRRVHDGGDPSAQEALVARYMPLAIRLARRYQGANEPFDDLKQAASVGLLNAINRFDPSRGVTFEAFAIPTILGELKRYFRDCCWSLHMPRGIQDLANKVSQTERQLLSRTGHSPTYQELAEYLELSVEDVFDAVEAAAAHHAISLDAPREGPDSDYGTLGDSFGEVDAGFERVEYREAIRTAMAGLSERERCVLGLRFIDDCTQSAIAQQVGVSQMQVSRILSQALAKLARVADV